MCVLSNFLWLQSFTANCSTCGICRCERLECLDFITAVLFSFNFSSANKQSGKTAKVEKCLSKKHVKHGRGEREEWGVWGIADKLKNFGSDDFVFFPLFSFNAKA